ncbi:MAG: LamG-like jellyroll fold domain-containing protein, partial [Bacteroidota bacterium]
MRSDITQRTVAMWIWIRDVDAFFEQILYDEGSDTYGVALRVDHAQLRMAIIDWPQQTIVDGPNLLERTWTHVAMVYDNGVARLYVNGVQVASETTGYGTIAGTNNQGGLGDSFQTDAFRDGDSDIFDGFMDDVRFYNNALTTEQIVDEMNNNGSRTALTAGKYYLKVTDNLGCVQTDSVLITEPPQLVVSLSANDVLCNGAATGSVNSSPSGGTTPYTYIWSNGSTTQNIGGLLADKYILTLTDNNGCTVVDSVTLTQPMAISVNATVTSSYSGYDLSCPGASNAVANATASGGVGTLSFDWSNGQTNTATMTGIGDGTYTVTATDANGCTATTTVTVSDPPAMALNTIVYSNYNGEHISCPGQTDGDASVSVTNGIWPYNFEWDNGQTDSTLNDVGAGTYLVTVTDFYGCTASSSVTLTDPTTLSVSTSVTSSFNGFDVSCNNGKDGAAEATPSGGTGNYTFAWSTGATTQSINSIGAGSYTVTVSDDNGCTATSTITLGEPTNIRFNTTASDPSDCGLNNGIIQIAATGGVENYEYSLGGAAWQGSNTFTGLAAGTYFAYVRSAFGTCEVGPRAVFINPPEAPTIDNITAINPTTSVSTDGGILVTASGSTAIEYSLDGTTYQSSNLFNGLTEGSYTIYVRFQGLSCVSSVNVTLTAGGGVVGNGGGINFCSEDLSGVSFVEVYYTPFPEDQILTALQTIYPDHCGGTDVDDPVQTYISIGIVEDGTILTYDHWEDGYETNPTFPVQSSTEVWGDGDLTNGVAPGYPGDLLSAADILVLNNAVNSTTLASVIDYDGGDKIGSRGNLSITRLGWGTGPDVYLAGALEVYPTASWGTTYDIPVGPNTNVSDLFEYTGATIMAKANNTVVSIDADGDNVFESTVTLNEGQGHLINSGLNSGARISADKDIQVHLITGDICHSYESRWFTLKPTDQWSDSYFNPVATPNDGSDAHDDFVNAPTYIHLYNPNGSDITVNWDTEAGFQGGVLVPQGGTNYIEIPDNTGTHFYSSGNEPFYAIATIDSDPDGNNARNDWGYALTPESALSSQITLVGFAPGSNPLYSNSENSAPIWLTASYPSTSSSSGLITVCIDYNGDGGSNTDGNGVQYDVSLVMNA